MNLFRRLAALLVMSAAIIAVPAAAIAAPTEAAPSVSVASGPTTSVAPVAMNLPVPDDDPGWSEWERYLPSTRWTTATQEFHGRFDQFLQNDVITWSHRNITQSTGMASGNTAYLASQGLLTFGLEMEPLNLLGEEADQVAATIGLALYQNSPVVVLIVVLIIGATIFRMMRTGQRPWRKIATAAGIVALFAIMTAGAQASTTGPSGDYEPGLGSPGWFATGISDTISSVASVPAAALTIESPVSASSTPDGSACETHMEYLDQRASEPGAAVAVPRLVSELWESSGLAVWKQVQYGTTPYTETGLTYGDHVFCHQLDWQAGVPSNFQMIATFGSAAAADAAGAVSTSPAWGASDNDQRDRSLIAWAACDVAADGDITVRPGWGTDKDGNTWISETACNGWWTATSETADLSAFNIGGKASDVTDKTNDPAVANFLLTLHGNDTGPGLVLTWGYGLSSLLMFLVFGSFGIAIAIAKFAGVVMVITIFFVMLMSLLAREEMTSRLAGFVKMYLGFTVFAFGATLILSMITVISRMLTGVGSSTFGPGTFMSLLLTGLSPVIAAYLLHLMFTKLFKAPSIFKPSSAMAWGSAFGAVGGVVGAGVVDRYERRGASLGRAAARGSAQATRNVLAGRPLLSRGPARAGSMVPSFGAGAARTAAGAAGAGTAGVGSAAAQAARAAASRAGGSAMGTAGAAFGGSALGAATALLASRVAAARKNRVDSAAPQTASARLGATVQAARRAVSAVRSPEFRQNASARAQQMIETSRARLAESSRRTQAVGEWFRQDPMGATGYVASNVGEGVKNASTIAARAARTTGASAVNAARTIASDPQMRAQAAVYGRGIANAGRVGLGALVGGVAAGAPGAIAGMAVGAGRAQAAENRVEARRLAEIEQQRLAAVAAEKAERDAKRAAREARADEREARRDAREAGNAQS